MEIDGRTVEREREGIGGNGGETEVWGREKRRKRREEKWKG